MSASSPAAVDSNSIAAPSDCWEGPALPEPCEHELLADARASCREMLKVDPDQPSALHLLGLLAARDKQDDLAIACFRRAIRLDENDDRATMICELAGALDRRGSHAEAISARLQVLRRRPRDAEAFRLLGQTLQHDGKHDAAVAAYRESLRLDSESVVTLGMLGDALGAADHVAEALAQHQACLRSRPNDADMYGRVGRLHLRQRDWTLARDAFGMGLRCAWPRDAERAALLLGLGQAQIFLGEHQAAVVTLREVLSIEPANLEALSRLVFALELLGSTTDTAQAWLSLGVALEDRARVQEAITSYQQVLARQPDCLDARIRLGSLHLLLGEVRHGIRHLESAVAIAPDHVAAHIKLGAARHLNGEAKEGWEELAWLSHPDRLKSWRVFEQPMWDGSSLTGRTILLWATPDLGLGDTIQFVRCVRLLKARGAHRVVVDCQRSLIPIVATMPDVNRVVTRNAPLPPFDVHAPLMLVPVLEHTAREPAASDVPYLSAEQRHIDAWRQELGVFDGLTVGLCWGAHSSRGDARLRTVPLSAFAPLSSVRNVRFVSLQLGPHADEAFVPPPGLLVRRMLSDSPSVAHTAALIQSLDLVITVDTMIAHLAGALSQSVWTLLPSCADWRWGREETTPWYPTMRLFRQRMMGDWADVIDRVGEELRTCRI